MFAMMTEIYTIEGERGPHKKIFKNPNYSCCSLQYSCVVQAQQCKVVKFTKEKLLYLTPQLVQFQLKFGLDITDCRTWLDESQPKLIFE